MAVSADEMAKMEGVLAAPDAANVAYATLRGQFPHLTFTRCDASDVDETPYRSIGLFDLHLIDTRDHCAHITDDPEQATGVILAKKAPAP